MRLHITGASGSGVTTLGAALAEELALLHLDADNYYWLPTQPPFRQKRHRSDRHAMLLSDLQTGKDIILTGSIVGWGDDLENVFDLIVFLYLPASVRVARLRKREIERYGAADPAFLEWAAQYDEGPEEGRSLAKHNAWLSQRQCPVLRLESNETVSERVMHVRQALLNSSLR
jgi:adenylate kinase family enzyme